MPPAQRDVANKYAQGKRLEAKVIEALRQAGFVTMRSAGSKGVVDVMAVRPGELLFVQVKRTRPPGPEEWNKLVDLAEWAGATPILATCPPYLPIFYEQIVMRKPIRRDPKVPNAPRTGCVPYRMTPTPVLAEPEPTEGEPQW